MDEELIQALTQFQRDLVEDIRRIIGEAFDRELAIFRDEMRKFQENTRSRNITTSQL